ncbi:regulator of nitric oxide reductase transcription [Dinoroseobacter shibae DFL 12 = DSM 16493]|jgi:transcriptional regulator of nitric oxide reductase|uniref:Regulator of nitric oxide reductase transcription n=1 Tax=Dinoroseobacter shibae (strain DSM 16493 / NCIMB 14021 / DFL 12) TaxID=398580 RepID=A8LQE6_DINSH|nr:4Fe-4S binding protein [Dinoroseobacter shibae]ABV92432.1 regulator of nitric oxide reductase transcription [Dinoroseobacter shibae DFL 12 = DSM 16493]URF47377.1 4Fe-4S binding protein [Dinoroseobacter shibae]
MMSVLMRLALVALLFLPLAGRAEPLSREEMAAQILPPFTLGEPLGENGVWSLLNAGGTQAGYVFETEPMAPLPGFSGAPINLLVLLDLEGRFEHVVLLEHNEPIFVSGLGEAPFHAFFEQYRGRSISDSLVVGTPYGGGDAGGGLIYLDGVTKATASVRIAHESILAATLQVARQKMQGVATGPPAYPDPNNAEILSFQDLIDQGLLTRTVVSNAEVQAQFADTIWEDDDPAALDEPEAPYLDLWIADLGPPAVARALLSEDGYAELQDFLEISGSDEPILMIETGRHGLVSEDFVRNTAPAWLSVTQDGLPVALRDSDILVELHPDLPDALQDGVAMILRTDRRLGFDPTREWTLGVEAVRSHGMLQPEIGSVTLTTTYASDPRFFLRPEITGPLPPWQEALLNRQTDLIVLAVFLAGLLALLAARMNWLAGLAQFTPVRLGILAFVTVFIGWWGQGQLSIVTVLGVLRTTLEGASFAFLLYDPFSLVIWGVTILGFVLWGRGLFCGWLCPFGALQEFAHHVGRKLRLPRIEPTEAWDRRLKGLKYVVLAGLIATVLIAPQHVDTVAEVEPFKTAITVFFVREWYYVAYAVLWLGLALVLFKGFCRYVCPLGAVMALGGLVRGRDWIARRAECGSPCQLCRVKCEYGAIQPTGEIAYSECFQCLDCVTIHDSKQMCVPLILEARKDQRVKGVAAK